MRENHYPVADRAWQLAASPFAVAGGRFVRSGTARARMAEMPLFVNGERVEDAVLSREAESLRQRFESLPDDQKKQYGLSPGSLERTAIDWARENVIEQVLLRQKALSDPRPIDADQIESSVRQVIERHGGPEKFAEAGLEERRVRDDIEARLRVDRLIGAVTSKARNPKPKELADAYRRDKQRFQTAETVRAAHIVKHVERGVTAQQAKQAADDLYARLQEGTSFEHLADSESDCPGNGGDLGYFARGKMVQEFEEVVFKLPVGAVSGVFQTVFGFHIAKVLDRQPAGVRPFSEVKEQLQKEFMDRRRTKLLEEYVDRLRAGATIEERARAVAR